MSNLVQIGVTALRTTPCRTCKSECCYAIRVNEEELLRMLEHLSTLDDEYVEALRKQIRPQGMCIFVDTEKWQCAVHPVRPIICKTFGYAPTLKCKYAPELSNSMTFMESMEKIRKPLSAGKLFEVGTTFTWDNVGVNKD